MPHPTTKSTESTTISSQDSSSSSPHLEETGTAKAQTTHTSSPSSTRGTRASKVSRPNASSSVVHDVDVDDLSDSEVVELPSYQVPKSTSNSQKPTSKTNGNSSDDADRKAKPKSKSPTAGPESIISQPFARFDQKGALQEWQEEVKGGEDFERELTTKMLSLMLELRVWAECRPQHVNDVNSETLVAEVDEIEARELKQEETRLSLVNFLASVREALKVLTHVPPAF